MENTSATVFCKGPVWGNQTALGQGTRKPNYVLPLVQVLEQRLEMLINASRDRVIRGRP